MNVLVHICKVNSTSTCRCLLSDGPHVRCFIRTHMSSSICVLGSVTAVRMLLGVLFPSTGCKLAHVLRRAPTPAVRCGSSLLPPTSPLHAPPCPSSCICVRSKYGVLYSYSPTLVSRLSTCTYIELSFVFPAPRVDTSLHRYTVRLGPSITTCINKTLRFTSSSRQVIKLVVSTVLARRPVIFKSHPAHSSLLVLLFTNITSKQAHPFLLNL